MKNKFPLFLASPSLFLVTLFVVALLSFGEVSLLNMQLGSALFTGPRSFSNYYHLLSSTRTWGVIGTSLRISFMVTVLCIIIGYPLAFVLARTRSSFVQRMILFGLVATLLSGGVTRAYAWMLILGNRGIINSALTYLGFSSIRLMNNETAVVISVLNFVLPFFVLTLFGALRTIPQTLEHAARNLGASRITVFTRITLPLSMTGLAVSTSLCFAMSLGAFLFPQMLGGGRVQVLSTSIYEKIQASYNIPEASALAFIFFVLVLVILGLSRLIHLSFKKRYDGADR